MTMMLVEQRADLAFELAERAVVMERGRVVFDDGAPVCAPIPICSTPWSASAEARRYIPLTTFRIEAPSIR